MEKTCENKGCGRLGSLKALFFGGIVFTIILLFANHDFPSKEERVYKYVYKECIAHYNHDVCDQRAQAAVGVLVKK